jgi:hypothetical protein
MGLHIQYISSIGWAALARASHLAGGSIDGWMEGPTDGGLIHSHIDAVCHPQTDGGSFIHSFIRSFIHPYIHNKKYEDSLSSSDDEQEQGQQVCTHPFFWGRFGHVV